MGISDMENILKGISRGATNRRTIGLVSVVLLHVLALYALVSGLARDVVKVVQQKVEVAVISEPPPPPPPPPPKIEKVVQEVAPQVQPQAYVPPVNTPPKQVQTESAIQATTSTPQPDAPPPAPVAAPAAPSGPISVYGNCSHIEKPEYPRKALADEVQGVVTARFKVGADGKPEGIASISFSSGISGSYRGMFRTAISQALQSYSCKTNLGEALLEQEFNFRLDA